MRDRSYRREPEKRRPIGVVCYSGHKAEELPRALVMEGRRIAVTDVTGMWIAEGSSDRKRMRCFKVRCEDDRIYEVGRDEDSGEWFLIG